MCFIAPTNVCGSEEQLNADLTSAENVERIRIGIAMQTGIYNTQTAFYAPYYRQITLAAYELPEETRLAALVMARKMC